MSHKRNTPEVISIELELQKDCPSFRAVLRRAIRVLGDRARELERSHRVHGSREWDDESAKQDSVEAEDVAMHLRGFLSSARVRSVSVQCP